MIWARRGDAVDAFAVLEGVASDLLFRATGAVDFGEAPVEVGERTGFRKPGQRRHPIA
jgi:hypothetical protein